MAGDKWSCNVPIGYYAAIKKDWGSPLCINMEESLVYSTKYKA